MWRMVEEEDGTDPCPPPTAPLTCIYPHHMRTRMHARKRPAGQCGNGQQAQETVLNTVSH